MISQILIYDGFHLIMLLRIPQMLVFRDSWNKIAKVEQNFMIV